MFQPAVEQLLLAKLNELRASKGLARLAVEGAFTGAARAHAMDMAQRNYLGHNSATGLDFSGRMKALQGGVMRYSTIGENAVMMYPPHNVGQVADTLFHSWLNSPPHLHNMLRSDFTRVATGAVILNGKAYADQIF
ncbi:MAG TPA: CAP domain-containing protein, partial [Aestuariivirga sp.]